MDTTQKFKCPRCDTIIDRSMDECPGCHTKFNWGASGQTGGSGRRDKTGNLLLKGFYWFKMLNIFFPLLGVILLIVHKDYNGNIKREKNKVYQLFKKNTITCCVVWGVIIIGLIIFGLISLKSAQKAVTGV